MLSFHRITVSLIVFYSLFGTCTPAQDKTGQDNSLFSIGYQQRIRIETTDNAVGLSETAGKGTSYIRNRTGLSARIVPSDAVTVELRLVNEFRYQFVPEFFDFKFGEIVVDQLLVRWDKAAGLPLTLTVGRQNMHLGEGFLIMDGAPLAGSRSVFFNAVRADWSIAPEKRLLLAYAYQPKHDKLPLYNLGTLLIERPEEGFIAYYMTDFFDGNAHAYFIRKNIHALDHDPISARINCPGLRVDYPIVKNLSIVGEAAVQFGSWRGNTMSAFGSYGYAKYIVGGEEIIPRSLSIGGVYLSGDDPATPKHEGWDPLFSRWPKWSESYIYALIPEQSVAYWSNFYSLYASILFAITPEISLSFDYHHLMAPRLPDPAKSFPGGAGKTRGELFIGKLVYKPKGILTGQVIFEGFKPGDFYFNGANSYGWMLMEVMVTL